MQYLCIYAVELSRAHASNGNPKRRHYALVCESASSILLNGGGMLDTATLRNIGGAYVGSSQITAVVERSERKGTGSHYPITTRARLVAPYAVTLRSPRELTRAERQLLSESGNNGKIQHDWLAVTKQLRRL